jgi:hydroxybutyrate-dimer hydrolase
MRILFVSVLLLLTVGCVAQRYQPVKNPVAGFLQSDIRVTAHANGDDLLSAGLALDGLRSATPPAFANSESPTAKEIRRRAIWTNWRGIADLSPGGGFGEVYGAIANVPGREFQAFAHIDGAKQPHRVLVQLPDDFDHKARCIVVAASSGSRGIYGAIALAGAWGLPRGCAVAYTDKGAGTGYFDLDSNSGVRLDGTRGKPGEPLEFSPHATVPPDHRVATKHAHSMDNPEADWGRHVLQAAQFALATLSGEFAKEAPYTFSNSRVLAVGLSNGGGAVLRAAELEAANFSGIVAVAPNILASAASARPLFDYATEAAIYQPCALLGRNFDNTALARLDGDPPKGWLQRCSSLHTLGLLKAEQGSDQAREALSRMRASGWTDLAIAAGAISSRFDLWRAVVATYAPAYGRLDVARMPCGYRFSVLGKDGKPRAPDVSEQNSWAADSTGIPPGAAVGIFDEAAIDDPDAALSGLLCLRSLWDSEGEQAQPIKSGIDEIRAKLPRRDIPIIVVQGIDDGMIPEAFSAGPYVRWVTGNGRDVRYWRIENAQHFDALLTLPDVGTRYLPMLPYAYRAIDAMWEHVANGNPLPESGVIATTPRGMKNGQPAALTSGMLGEWPQQK